MLTASKINPGVLTKLLNHVKILGSEDLVLEIVAYRDSLNAHTAGDNKPTKSARDVRVF